MHDGEDAGAFIIVGCRSRRVLEHPADIGIAAFHAGRHARADNAVDLAAFEHLVQGPVGRRGFEFDAFRQLQCDLFDPPRLIHAAPHPGYVGRLDAELVMQKRSGPDAGGELILRRPDPPALEIGGFLDAPVGADHDRSVAEGPGGEHRHADIGIVAVRGLHREAAQGKFADIEGGVAEGPEEHFFGGEQHEDGVDAVDLDRAVDEGTDPVVIAHGDGELELGHGQALPHISRATSTTSRNFAISSSTVSLLPFSLLANPHCGLRAS